MDGRLPFLSSGAIAKSNSSGGADEDSREDEAEREQESSATRVHRQRLPPTTVTSLLAKPNSENICRRRVGHTGQWIGYCDVCRRHVASRTASYYRCPTAHGQSHRCSEDNHQIRRVSQSSGERRGRSQRHDLRDRLLSRPALHRRTSHRRDRSSALSSDLEDASLGDS
jgi:hypothetical protein